MAIFRKLAKKRQVDFFYKSEYEITRSLTPVNKTQSWSYERSKVQDMTCQLKAI